MYYVENNSASNMAILPDEVEAFVSLIINILINDNIIDIGTKSPPTDVSIQY